ncbi:3D domain-containing protein [uncultured Subdoligranulum sp.]|uniref:3D domain-containing protein n=1 Tax=uncultured Subdoligranulum sp. TaxID=512298 RepID=UPI0026321B77|nr:3D domain-containing protein [uncultured Subdoligranulum sp.]
MPLSVKTKEHIRRRMELELPKWGTLLGGALALGLAIAFTSQSLHFVVVSDTHGGSVRILTSSDSEEVLLAQTDTPPLGEHDEIVWSQIADGEQMQVLRAYTVPVTADGETHEVITTGATAAELLAGLGITYDEDDWVTPAADEVVTEGSSLTLQRVEYVEYTEEVVVPTERQEIPTSLFYRDEDETMVLQEGSDGLDTVTWRDVYLDGVWSEKQEVERITQVEMVPTVVKVYGEETPVSSFVGPEIVDGVPSEGVTETYTGQRSTGYSASATAKGASGRRLTYGTVAVDPSIIPYGTLLYITSDDGKFVYGYAYAADTGTALMTGHAFVDLYYQTYEESVESAVIPVTVYVIDDAVAAQYEEQNDEIMEMLLAEAEEEAS